MSWSRAGCGLAFLFLATVAGCATMPQKMDGKWTGYVSVVDVYDGQTAYRAAALRIVDAPDTPYVTRFITDEAEYDEPFESDTPVLTDEEGRLLSPSGLTSCGLIRVKGWVGGFGFQAAATNGDKPLYLAYYDPAPPPRNWWGIGRRATAIRVTRIKDAKGRSIHWSLVEKPDASNAAPAPNVPWHDSEWLKAHLLGVVQRVGAGNWLVTAGSCAGVR